MKYINKKYIQPAQCYFCKLLWSGNGGRTPCCGRTSSVADCVDSVLTVSRADRSAHEEDRGPPGPSVGRRGPPGAGERLSLSRSHQVYASRAANRRALVSVTASKMFKGNKMVVGVYGFSLR